MNLLLMSLPGIYPSFPAVGLEMTAHGLREMGHAPAVVNGHLEMARFMEPRLLRTLCLQNIWDLLYAFWVYPKAKVGLRNKSVLKMLTDPAQSYQFSEEDLIRVTSAVSRFNRQMMNRLARYSTPLLIGFNVQNNQLLAAKYFARELKARLGGGVITVAGGASVRDGLGRSIIDHHPEFDYAVEENGIDVLDALLRAKNPAGVKGFFFRGLDGRTAGSSAGKATVERVRESDLTYEAFYTLRKSFDDVCDFSVFHPWDGLPAMLAAGCRWGRCRFCNLRQTHAPHDVGTVCKAIRERSEATGLSKVFLLDLSQPDGRDLRAFFSRIERDRRSYLFGAMFRCDIGRDDLIRFKKNGLDICHMGIEAYSDRLLKKMNKGVSLIDIAKTLVTCVEEGIRCEGNLLVNLPWEQAEDVVETGRNLDLLAHLPMPRIISYKLSHGSINYKKPEPDWRMNWVPEPELQYAYPPDLRDRVKTMYYARRKSRLLHEKLWLDVIAQYKRYSLHPPQLLFEVFPDGLLIFDSRPIAAEKRWFVKGKTAVRLYQYCRDTRTLADIRKHFNRRPVADLEKLLNLFVDRSVMMRSGDRFLSIAMRRN